MKLNTLKLSNFRNYNSVFLKFNNHLNIIYGNNSEGKTNLVEAIYVLSLTRSFRTNNDKMLIKNGELSTKIEGEVEEKSKNNYQVIINKDGKKVKINNNIVSKLSDYITNINVIILEPDEQIIFTSPPAVRRKLINIEISKLDNNYIIYLNNYNRILKQRNFYLRDLYVNGNEQGNLFIKYCTDYKNKSEEEIISYYEKNYNREITMGKTLYGIHHDDIVFMLDDKEISEWGSNGQKKNAIFAFKLAEIELIKINKNTLPILILDDLFSALDNHKIKNIINLLNDNIQTFITTTELERIDKKLLKTSTIFKIEKGQIMEESK